MLQMKPPVNIEVFKTTKPFYITKLSFLTAVTLEILRSLNLPYFPSLSFLFKVTPHVTNAAAINEGVSKARE